MAVTHKWGALGSKITALSSSQLNNVANAAQKISSAISYDTNLYLFMDVMLKLSTATGNRAAGAHARLYLLADLGDSNYSFGSSSLDPGANNWLCNFNFDSGATAARVNVQTMLPIPPENFKLLLENRTGQPFTSCTVLSYRRYYMQST